MIELSPLACSQHWNPPRGEGHCLTIYRHAINLSWPDGRLLTLHKRGHGLSPVGAVLAGDDFDWLAGALEPGADVWGMDDGGVLLPACRIRPARRVLQLDSKLRPSAGATRALGTLRSWLLSQDAMTGLGLSTVRILYAGGSSLGDEVASISRALMMGQLLPADAFGGLVGRGEGATPAGDDILIGIMAAASLRGYPLAPMAIPLFAWLSARPGVTTEISRSYLVHALQGYFSLPLNRLRRQLAAGAAASKQFAEFCRHGHTSGIDTLTGMALLGEDVV